MPTHTVTTCVNCDRDAGRRPYLVARTQVGTFRQRICASCMEGLSTALTDRETADRLLTLLLVRFTEKTLGPQSRERRVRMRPTPH